MSYKRFLSYIPGILDYLFFYLMLLLRYTLRTGIYFIDSTKIPVCHYNRRYSHKVFDGIAQAGKTSTGWFFGLKIHLIINHLGDLIRVEITPGNVADNKHELLKKMLSGLKGTILGDKGYLTKLLEIFQNHELTFITKVKRNMKNKLITPDQRRIDLLPK